jgi:hypothetical protein
MDNEDDLFIIDKIYVAEVADFGRLRSEFPILPGPLVDGLPAGDIFGEDLRQKYHKKTLFLF